MEFPQITTQEVFDRIPKMSLEANAEFHWNNVLYDQGICEYEKTRISGGIPDSIIRYYNSDKSRFVWLIGEYKSDSKNTAFTESIIQLLMYLGNFFYDTNPLGLDDFAGVYTASPKYFMFIPAKNIFGVMEKFEYIWRKHFREAPCDAYKHDDIKQFQKDNWDALSKDCEIYTDGGNCGRLDLIIKNIYKEWNLQ